MDTINSNLIFNFGGDTTILHAFIIDMSSMPTWTNNNELEIAEDDDQSS